ncbi:MAG: type II toxin-antitoxin system RelE/ParE family toxin [Syntrophus sp. (in: bacteria)]|nr:type II toxin-antitoxin system RelE/ParE family toxin [Syntrophus sp. (in: bacteria)]
MWQIKLSKQATSFAEQERITDDKVLALVKKIINYAHGQTENLDVKKLKGAWKGYHRVRVGKIRMILKIDFDKHIIFIDRIDFRGNVYK